MVEVLDIQQIVEAPPVVVEHIQPAPVKVAKLTIEIPQLQTVEKIVEIPDIVIQVSPRLRSERRIRHNPHLPCWRPHPFWKLSRLLRSTSNPLLLWSGWRPCPMSRTQMRHLLPPAVERVGSSNSAHAGQ